MAIAAVFTVWVFIKRSAEYKPLQFLAFAFVYRIFEKLKAAEPNVAPSFSEQGEDEGRMMRTGKRLLRSLALVFGCIAFASLGLHWYLEFLRVHGWLYSCLLVQQSGSTASCCTLWHHITDESFQQTSGEMETRQKNSMEESH